ENPSIEEHLTNLVMAEILFGLGPYTSDAEINATFSKYLGSKSPRLSHDQMQTLINFSRALKVTVKIIKDSDRYKDPAAFSGLEQGIAQSATFWKTSEDPFPSKEEVQFADVIDHKIGEIDPAKRALRTILAEARTSQPTMGAAGAQAYATAQNPSGQTSGATTSSVGDHDQPGVNQGKINRQS